jgi:hypothetical protein
MSGEDKFNAELPDELKIVEDVLRQLTPRASQLDRDRLMYLAGRASAMNSADARGSYGFVRTVALVRRNWWPVATAALVVVSITLGGLLVRATSKGERVVYVALEGGNEINDRLVAESFPAGNFRASTVLTNQDGNYLELRNLVLNRGMDALPKSLSTDKSGNRQNVRPAWPVRDPAFFGNDS